MTERTRCRSASLCSDNAASSTKCPLLLPLPMAPPYRVWRQHSLELSGQKKLESQLHELHICRWHVDKDCSKQADNSTHKVKAYCCSKAPGSDALQQHSATTQQLEACCVQGCLRQGSAGAHSAQPAVVHTYTHASHSPHPVAAPLGCLAPY